MYIDLFSDILFFFFFLLQKTISTSRDYLIGAITAKTDVEKKEMLIKYEAYFFFFPPFLFYFIHSQLIKILAFDKTLSSVKDDLEDALAELKANETKTVLEKCVELSPESPQLRLRRANYWLSTEQPWLAIPDLLFVLQHSQEFSKEYLFIIYHNI